MFNLDAMKHRQQDGTLACDAVMQHHCVCSHAHGQRAGDCHSQLVLSDTLDSLLVLGHVKIRVARVWVIHLVVMLGPVMLSCCRAHSTDWSTAVISMQRLA